MAFKPNVISQLNGDTGMARAGGITSAASAPGVMMGTSGANFATMENSLLKGLMPDPKKMALGSNGKQYAGGGRPKRPKKLPVGKFKY